MTTELKYYSDPYCQEVDTIVTAIEDKGGRAEVVVETTIFYPEGGGQPSDKGEIKGPNGTLRVDNVRAQVGEVTHAGVLAGRVEVGDPVHLHLKWNYRLRNMRVHAAGHLLHDVLMSLQGGLEPRKGAHGKKAYLEYAGEMTTEIKEQLETAIDEAIKADLPISMRESSYEEIVEQCRFVPDGLPRNKPLRVLQIGEYDPMPDGGVHVATTGEIGAIVIQDVRVENGGTFIRYRVTGG